VSVISGSEIGNIQEHILGFDARELWLDGDRWWSDERKSRYLLRQVMKPLSTDVLVWPSVFGDGLPPSERTRLDLDGLAPPDWRGANQSLWDDLARMQSQLTALGPAVRGPYHLVAVTWHSREGSVASSVGPYPEPTNPMERSPGWRFLGYDISDGSLLSGLSNCGYTDEDRGHHRARWGPHLNEHHLFNDLGHAFDFRRACDLRVPEHAPFFVFGLWSVE
jgi:hypothetical protein